MKFRANLVLIAAPILLALASCQPSADVTFPGYVEGEYLRVASPFAGSLTSLAVKRGDHVAAGAPLFALEQDNEKLLREEAAARVTRAEAQMANLGKGRRPEEIEAIRAQLAQAEASLTLSVSEFKRTQDLVKAKFVSPAKLDEAQSAVDRDRSRMAELNAQLKVANLAGRSDELAAARAEVSAAKEVLAQADWRLAQKSQKAPRAGLVADTLYVQGEWVQAGLPVVSLLPAENVKVRFFVSEPALSTVTLGKAVQVSCDGCGALEATVSFVSPQAEYTSPLIYSKENRAKLVFLIEARVAEENARKLHPGQPVEVRL